MKPKQETHRHHGHRRIVVNLSIELHEAIREIAHQRRQSMNSLCLDTLGVLLPLVKSETPIKEETKNAPG